MIAKKILSVVPYSIRLIRKLSLKSLDGSMPLQQLRILFLINEGRRQSEMAEILQVSGAAISKMINILVEKELVERESVTDRRCVGLFLTTKGKKVLKIVSGDLEKKIDKEMEKLSKKELTKLYEGLEVLEKIMGQLNDEI